MKRPDPVEIVKISAPVAAHFIAVVLVFAIAAVIVQLGAFR